MPRYFEFDVALQDIQPRIWRHDVKLIRVVSDKDSFKRRLLNGERACPPEDCGHLPGYENLVHFIQTGKDIVGDDPEELRIWLGGWTQEAFDNEAVKAKFDQ